MTDTLKNAHRRTQATNGLIASSINRAGHALVGRGKVRMTAPLGREFTDEFTDWVMILRGRLGIGMILEAAGLRKRYAVESCLETHHWQMPRRTVLPIDGVCLLEALGVMIGRTAAHKLYYAKRDSHVVVSISWLVSLPHRCTVRHVGVRSYVAQLPIIYDFAQNPSLKSKFNLRCVSTTSLVVRCSTTYHGPRVLEDARRAS